LGILQAISRKFAAIGAHQAGTPFVAIVGKPPLVPDGCLRQYPEPSGIAMPDLPGKP
jgi:hypothetical protein